MPLIICCRLESGGAISYHIGYYYIIMTILGTRFIMKHTVKLNNIDFLENVLGTPISNVS